MARIPAGRRPLGRERICHPQRADADRRLDLDPRVRAAHARGRRGGARLLMKAAARALERRLGDARHCAAASSCSGDDKLRFAELAEAASAGDLPEYLPLRGGIDNRLTGQSLPRLDLPAKVDGSAQFAGDMRLPDMVYASVRSGPGAASAGSIAVDRAAARRCPASSQSFAIDRFRGGDRRPIGGRPSAALDAMRPRFDRRGAAADDRGGRGGARRRARPRTTATGSSSAATSARSMPAGKLVQGHLSRSASPPMRRWRPLTATARIDRRPAGDLGADPGARQSPAPPPRAPPASPRAR